MRNKHDHSIIFPSFRIVMQNYSSQLTLSHLNFKNVCPSCDIKQRYNLYLTFSTFPLCISHLPTSKINTIKHIRASNYRILTLTLVCLSLVLSPNLSNATHAVYAQTMSPNINNLCVGLPKSM